MAGAVRKWPIGWIAAGAVVGLLWLLRNTWPVQTVLVLFAILTGIDIQNLWDPPVRWNVKQTMVIETPHGDVKGSVVRSRVMRKDRLAMSAPIWQKGEALAIEVSPGRYLFALIEDYKPDETQMLPNYEWLGKSAWKLLAMKGKPLQVARDRYPLMVTFGDLKDPASVQEVDPFYLSATFGPGYRIRSYEFEITDEPRTAGKVEKLLPWLGPFPEPSLCRPTSRLDFSFCAAEVNHGNFIAR